MGSSPQSIPVALFHHFTLASDPDEPSPVTTVSTYYILLQRPFPQDLLQLFPKQRVRHVDTKKKKKKQCCANISMCRDFINKSGRCLYEPLHERQTKRQTPCKSQVIVPSIIEVCSHRELDWERINPSGTSVPPCA